MKALHYSIKSISERKFVSVKAIEFPTLREPVSIYRTWLVKR